ncbi:uncharacterized protein EAE98_006953 [Botrytis deweyae]|uniref:Uncharacterized protein n=1 Tax=Botrytis deweyae TaxID=2478750 RepID=A0ABQ7IJF7_9HELO|nr:uncharacterized protein EAE98_006953 [Botrytis deweyae]KAF7924508.1 hypothetical protein EAE99_006456 [Botrytis elliptica]KAF7925728.1 hypothetical protein EAE98_006953 [Botrytis deweyae]
MVVIVAGDTGMMSNSAVQNRLDPKTNVVTLRVRITTCLTTDIARQLGAIIGLFTSPRELAIIRLKISCVGFRLAFERTTDRG